MDQELESRMCVKEDFDDMCVESSLNPGWGLASEICLSPEA